MHDNTNENAWMIRSGECPMKNQGPLPSRPGQRKPLAAALIM
jgi:hypothetical protein